MVRVLLCLLPAIFLSSGVFLSGAVFLSSAASAWSGELREVSFRLDGHERNFLLYAPDRPAVPDAGRPLVLVLHGGGGTHRNMVRLTRQRWHELAEQHGFLVAYPNALEKLWDFGEGFVPPRLNVRVDDLAYFSAVIERVATAHKIDRSRIFATGISRGGQASFFLACKLDGVVRAIAPVTMPLPAFLQDDCAAGPPVGVMVINGTADPLVPYDGGHIRVFRRKRGKVLSTDATMELWRRRNGCAAAARQVADIDRPGDATSVQIFEWQDCRGAPVSLIRVEGGGHTWPGGRPYLGRRLIGEVSNDIDASEVIWRFFSRF